MRRVHCLHTFCAAIAMLLFVPACSDAQQSGNIFDHITTQHGLSSNGVSDMIQDREGFYWICTQNGLNRFDGTNFKIYYNQAGDTNSLVHNHCTSIAEDDDGNIWVGTMKGVSCFIKKKNHFRNYIFQHSQLATDNVNRIFSILKDRSGNIWTSGMLLMKFDTRNQKWTNYSEQSPFNKEPNLSSIKHAVYDQRENGFWATTSQGLYFILSESGAIYHADNNPRQWKVFSEGKPRLIDIDTKGNLWYYDMDAQTISFYNTENNIVRLALKVDRPIRKIRADDRQRLWIFYWTGPSEIFDAATGKAESSVFTGNYPKSVLNPTLVNLFIDRDRNYWIASNHGINVLNHRNQYFRYYVLNDKPDNPLEGSLQVLGIAEANNSALWVATSQGLYRYETDDGKEKRIKAALPGKPIRSILNLADTVLWLGSDNLLRFDFRTGSIKNVASTKHRFLFIRRDKNGNIWSSTWSEGVFCFDSKGNQLKHLGADSSTSQSLRSNSLVAFEPGREEGIFWIGYNGGEGFSKYNSLTNHFEHFRIRQPGDRGLVSNTINCIYEDTSGNLWLGTYGSGLYYFDRVQNRFVNYLQSDGLYSNYVNAIQADKEGNLWINTSMGVNYLNTRTRQIIPVPIDLAMLTNDFVTNSSQGKDGVLYFFRENIIAAVRSGRFTREPAKHLPLRISSVKIFDHEIPFSSTDPVLSLSHRQNFFSFDFSVIKTNPILPVQYAYQLKGFDKGWNYAIDRTTVNYTNVPPGQYSFLLKATDQTGQWLYEAIPVDIRITPPFWKAWWFISFVALSIAAGIILLFRYRLKRIKEIYSLRSKISQDLHDEVGATLTSISFLSEVARKQVPAENTGVAGTLIKIGEYSREMIGEMNDIVWAINPANDRFDKIADRIHNFASPLLSARNIQFDFNADLQLRNLTLNMQQRKNLYLIFKEALNNAAKYADCSLVRIKVSRKNNFVHFEIEDNGKGFTDNNNQTGNGLNNMRDRAAEVKARIRIRSNPGAGTVISIAMPITQNAD